MAPLVLVPILSPVSPPPTTLLSLEMMVQLRYEQTSVSIAPGTTALLIQQYAGDPGLVSDGQRLITDSVRQSDGFWLRRAFVHAAVNPSDDFKGEVLLDLARLLYDVDYKQTVRFAFGQYAPIPRVALSAGVLLLEEDYVPEFAELGPTHELLTRMRFIGPEPGLLLDVAPLPQTAWLHLEAAALDGGATGGQSFRGPGLLVFRALAKLIGHLELDAALSWRPRPLTAWWEELRFFYQEYDAGKVASARAAVTYPWFSVAVEGAGGDRTDNDVLVPLKQRRGDARTWWSVSGMAAARIPIARRLLVPAARIEWLDSDLEHANLGAVLEMTGAVGFWLSPRMQVLLDLTQHYVQFGTPNWRFDFGRYDTDYRTGTVQLQMQM
jgi:hypothetical protein